MFSTTWLSLPGLHTDRRERFGQVDDEVDVLLPDGVADDLQRVADDLVGVDLLALGLVEPGEVAERGDDLADPLQAVLRALDEAVEARQRVGEVDPRLGVGRSPGERLAEVVAVEADQVGDDVHVAVEDGEVVGDVGERVVDLVGDPRDELAEAGHLLALDEVGLGLAELAEGRGQLVALEPQLVLGALAVDGQAVPVEGPTDGRGEPGRVDGVLGDVVRRPPSRGGRRRRSRCPSR